MGYEAQASIHYGILFDEINKAEEELLDLFDDNKDFYCCPIGDARCDTSFALCIKAGCGYSIKEAGCFNGGFLKIHPQEFVMSSLIFEADKKFKKVFNELGIEYVQPTFLLVSTYG